MGDKERSTNWFVGIRVKGIWSCVKADGERDGDAVITNDGWVDGNDW